MERRAVIAAGFGFRRGAGTVSLRAALALAQQGQPPVTLLAAPLDKLAALVDIAAELDLPLVGITPEALMATSTRSRSLASLSARQTGSVSEASALAAAGSGSVLIAGRCISADRLATCAIAKGVTA